MRRAARARLAAAGHAGRRRRPGRDRGLARERSSRPGAVDALPGDVGAARRRLDAVRQRRGAGWLAAQEGDASARRGHCRLVLARWERSQDHHYAVWGLRWSAGWLAGDRRGSTLARACTEALSSIAASSGHRRRAGRAGLRDRRDRAGRGRRRRRRGAVRPRRRAARRRSASRSSARRSWSAPPRRWPRSGERDAALDQLADAHRLATALAPGRSPPRSLRRSPLSARR